MGSKTYDSVIIGGGVIGLSIARALRHQSNGRILLLEKGNVGREASWAAAGILAPQIEADADDDFFRLCFESNKMYPQFAAELRDETGIDVELDRSGTLCVGFDGRDEEEFARRYSWQSAAGLSIKKLDRKQVIGLEPNISDNVRSGLFFPDEGQVENRKLVEALAAFTRSNDIELHEGIEVGRILMDRGRLEGVETAQGRLSTANVVIATGAWTSLIKLGENRLPVDVKPMRGQMISYKDTPVPINHVIYSRTGYLVPRSDGRLLAGATVEDVGFDRSTTETARSLLMDMAIEIAPRLQNESISEHWAGFRPYGNSGRPLIGPIPNVDNVFVATGHFRNGILLAPITGKLIADIVTGANDSRRTGISQA